jgi:CubicO group peptidase (beta-lactamase class C family)
MSHRLSLAARSPRLAALGFCVLACARAAATAAPPQSSAPSPPTNISSGGVTAPLARAVADTAGVVMRRALADSAFPGGIAVIGSRTEVLATVPVGHADWGGSPAVDENTMWDMASLTKVVGLTSAMMQLVEHGKVDLDAPVQRYLPEWQGPNKERVTVRHLLTHSSGLPAWRPLYKEGTSPESALSLVFLTPLDTVPGVRMVYSDLGAILLGQIVVRVTGEPFERYVATHVFEPLKMTSTMFRPPASLKPRIAPTEFDPWRQRKIWGEVHDENAFALGGISSHAGLFSTGRDVARFCRMYLSGGTLDGARIFSPETIARFTTLQDSALSNRALGWEKPNGVNSGGHLMSRRAFGHTGFTGTSIWMDPERDLFVILLTNRVNPTRQNLKISGVRIALADAVVAAAERVRASSSGSRP